LAADDAESESQPSQDRRVAEWAIVKGGTVVVRAGDRSLHLRHASQVPDDDFRVVELHLNPAHYPREGEQLLMLAGLKHLKLLDVQDWEIEDRELALLSELKSLETLVLAQTKITSRGLRHLLGLSNLKRKYLCATKVDDEAVPTLSRLSGLERC
jgi:hypothetical protein